MQEKKNRENIDMRNYHLKSEILKSHKLWRKERSETDFTKLGLGFQWAMEVRGWRLWRMEAMKRRLKAWRMEAAGEKTNGYGEDEGRTAMEAFRGQLCI